MSSLSLNSTGNSNSPIPFTDTDTALQMEEVKTHPKKCSRKFMLANINILRFKVVVVIWDLVYPWINLSTQRDFTNLNQVLKLSIGLGVYLNLRPYTVLYSPLPKTEINQVKTHINHNYLDANSSFILYLNSFLSRAHIFF